MRKKLLIGLLTVGTLFSCETDNEPKPSQELKSEVVSEFNFAYDTSPKVLDFELIISQKDGKVLLDTLIASHASHNLHVKSTDTKFDVTTILYDQKNNYYYVKTYGQVDPNNWHINKAGSPSPAIAREKTSIAYKNLPINNLNVLFMAREFGSGQLSLSNNTISVNYNRIKPTDMAFLLLPERGKYFFNEITAAENVIDYSEAKDVVKHKYNKPAGITGFRSYLYGYNSDGESSFLYYLFGFGGVVATAEYDLQSPSSGFTGYNLDLQYYDAEKHWHTYKFLNTSIPSEVAFEAASDFTVTKSGFDDFQISFATEKPSTYSTGWNPTDENYKIRWDFFNSPEETSFKPKAYIENLKSKILPDKPVSLKLVSVTSYKAKDRSHQAYLNHMSVPAEHTNNPMKHYRTIVKYF
jgi:hypothetical protein